jgi:hypothetical protein
MVQAVLNRLAQQQQQKQKQTQTQGGLPTTRRVDAQEPGIEDGRDVPEGFPVYFVAERERCVSLVLGCTGGAEDESAEAPRSCTKFWRATGTYSVTARCAWICDTPSGSARC